MKFKTIYDKNTNIDVYEDQLKKMIRDNWKTNHVKVFFTKANGSTREMIVKECPEVLESSFPGDSTVISRRNTNRARKNMVVSEVYSPGLARVRIIPLSMVYRIEVEC